jgi:hypothetical protein
MQTDYKSLGDFCSLLLTSIGGDFIAFADHLTPTDGSLNSFGNYSSPSTLNIGSIIAKPK